MRRETNRVCPIVFANTLTGRGRRWLQDPERILSPFVEEGMTALDVGCGPGYFSIALAGLVGRTGRVIAADLQDGMLRKLRNSIRGTELEERILLVKCESDTVNVSGKERVPNLNNHRLEGGGIRLGGLPRAFY